MPRVANPNGVSKRQQAYERLRQALVLGQISAGQRLREAEWAERLGVNRAAIREACGRLCVEGLVVEGPKRGYVRTRLSPADARDALEVRCLLETGAIERICRLGLNDSRRLEPLQKACDELEWLLHNGYRLEVTESDLRFHEALVAISGSPRLAHAYRCIPLMSPESGGEGGWETAAQTILKDHKVLLATIRKGRAGEARRRLRDHLIRKPGMEDEPGVGVA